MGAPDPFGQGHEVWIFNLEILLGEPRDQTMGPFKEREGVAKRAIPYLEYPRDSSPVRSRAKLIARRGLIVIPKPACKLYMKSRKEPGTHRLDF